MKFAHAHHLLDADNIQITTGVEHDGTIRMTTTAWPATLTPDLADKLAAHLRDCAEDSRARQAPAPSGRVWGALGGPQTGDPSRIGTPVTIGDCTPRVISRTPAEDQRTPGQAACEAWWRSMGTGPDGQPDDAAWEWARTQGTRDAWEAAAAPARGDVEQLRRQLADAMASVRRLEDGMNDAYALISHLDRLRPTCVICLDATADRQTSRGPACTDCVGDLPGDDPGPSLDDPGTWPWPSATADTVRAYRTGPAAHDDDPCICHHCRASHPGQKCTKKCTNPGPDQVDPANDPGPANP